MDGHGHIANDHLSFSKMNNPKATTKKHGKNAYNSL